MIFAYTKEIKTHATTGAATVYFASPTRGKVHAIKYEPGTIATGAGIVITGETSGVPIITKADMGTSTVWLYPRRIPHKVDDGSVFTDVAEEVQAFNERIKLALASGGNSKTGSMTIYIEK